MPFWRHFLTLCAQSGWDLSRPKRAHFTAPALQTPPKFHERTPRGRERRKKIVAGEKKREILGPPPFGAPPFGVPPFGAPPFGAPPFGGPTLRAPPFGGPTLGGPKIQHPKIGRSRNWPKSKLAEVEIGRSRTGRTRKKKLAEVEKLAEVDRARLQLQSSIGHLHHNTLCGFYDLL